MKKGQGSLEYLLILAAVLAIAVVVVVVANQLMQGGGSQVSIADSIYNCGTAGVSFVAYTKLYDGVVSTTGGIPTVANSPLAIKFINAAGTQIQKEKTQAVQNRGTPAAGVLTCTLKGTKAGATYEYKVYVDKTTNQEKAFIETADATNQFLKYG